MESEIGHEVVNILVTEDGGWKKITFAEYAGIKSKMNDKQRKAHEDNKFNSVMPFADGPIFLFIKETCQQEK